MNATIEVAVCEEAVRVSQPLHKKRQNATYFGDLSGALTSSPAPVHRDQDYWVRLSDGFLKGIR
jgi:hypothetical protein